MTETYGISSGGGSAEQRFRDLTGARPPSRSSDGDAVLEGHAVEVKRAASATLNQVRAVKYLPLVVWDDRSGDWYVVPAHVAVAEVSRKRRGQHTENPFESATLSLNRLRKYRVDEAGELRLRRLDAIEASSGYLRLRDEMERVLADSRALADETIARVRRVREDLGIEADPRHEGPTDPGGRPNDPVR